jgi:GntR family transcriptional regulator, transcriptional repressor for pyruvate dehydrogenase complex
VLAPRRPLRAHDPGPHLAGLTQEDAVSRALHEHRAILTALRDRDTEAACSWATVHIASVEQ